jgi:hypothetical protein
MTLSIDAGIIRGEASGKLAHVTEKYAQTFDFKTCFVQPAP